MKEAKIQTLHPQPGKTNKRIALDKYNVVRQNILAILANAELTHSELMEKLYSNVKDFFDGGVQWYCTRYSGRIYNDLLQRQCVF